MVTALLEMCFANEEGGLQVDLSAIPEPDLVKLLFAENPGVLVQTSAPELLEEVMTSASIGFARIATPTVSGRTLEIHQGKQVLTLNIDEKRDLWYRPSFLMDQYQSGESLAKERYTNYKKQPLRYVFPEGFTGKFKELHADQSTSPCSHPSR